MKQRFLRFDDVYLTNEDPTEFSWGPRDEAHHFESSQQAHDIKREAKKYYGQTADIVVVRVGK